MQLIIGLIGLLIILIGFYIYMQIANVSFPFYPYALLCFAPTFFSCFYNFLLVDIKMKRQALNYFKIVLLKAIVTALLAILFVAVLKGGAIGRFWSVLIPALVLGIFSYFVLVTKFQISRKIFRDALKFGWPISLSAILYYFLSGIDRALLEQLNDKTTFGIYNVAAQITAYLYIFYSSLIQTFEPDIYRTIAENNRKKLIKIVMGIIILNSIPVILFIFFAYPIVRILTYGRYVDSVPFAQVLAVKSIAMSICYLISDVIVGYGYPKVELINRVVGAVLSIILFKVLISRYGFYGAAWGQSIAYVALTILSSLFIFYKIISSRRKILG